MASQRDGGIAWCDETWNPVRGCSRVSEGCRHCYAETVAARFSGPGMPYEGLADRSRSGSKWTGVVRLVEDHLADPLKWRKPRRVFVNSMSDLFHESLSDGQIARIFNVMSQAGRHTFQVLTKRADRMKAYTSSPYYRTLPNVWLGVSVENQQAADERIPLLLDTPAAVRFISAEPLLGGIDIAKHRPGARGLHWCIVGGESGHGARECKVWWIRNLIGQCRYADVAVFVKQLGARPTFDEDREHGDWLFCRITDRKGGDMAEWPDDLRVREFPREATA